MRTSTGNWSALPSEMLSEIAGRLKMAEDFALFRAICSTWRAAADKDIFTGISKVPLLILEKKDDSSNERRLYSFPNSRMLAAISLPEPEVESKRCIGAGFGWLLIQTVTEEVSLLNPISGAQIHLPSLANFPVYDLDSDFNAGYHPPTVKRAALSADPCDDPSNFSLVITVRAMMLCCWRVGDRTWTKKNAFDLEIGGFESVCFCGGKFYIVEWCGHIIAWDPSTKDEHFDYVMDLDTCFGDDGLYLVESFDGNLMLVKRKFVVWHEVNDPYETRAFEVIKIDVKRREWRRIFDLENCAVFVGDNPVICIRSSTFPDVIKPNCIYFTEDSPTFGRERGKDLGVYNMGAVSPAIERFMESPGFVASPIWMDSSIISKSGRFRI